MDAELSPTPAPPEQHGPGAWFELAARIGDLGQSVATLAAEQREQARVAAPLETTRKAAGAVPASGTLLLDLGAPSMGRRWSIRSLAVANGGGVTASLAGQVAWYVGNPAAYGPGEWAAPTMATLPALQFVSSDQLNVLPTDRLFAVLTGGTPGQPALARAFLLDYPLYVQTPTISL